MRRVHFPILISLVAALTLAASAPRARHRAGAEPGVFDYYLLALSWSPQYCAGPGASRDAAQCGEGKRFGFVVHGLWPQFERGYPADCAGAAAVPAALVRQMLPLMPSERLIQHEWRKHGTCSGRDPARYFALVRQAHAAVRIPDEYRRPDRPVYASPARIRANFAAANPGAPPDGVRLTCSGRFLSEVRVCLTKDLKIRACGAGVRDSCRMDEIIMQPLR